MSGRLALTSNGQSRIVVGMSNTEYVVHYWFEQDREWKRSRSVFAMNLEQAALAAGITDLVSNCEANYQWIGKLGRMTALLSLASRLQTRT